MPITGNNQTSVQEKADALFMIYLMMGPERTLERLLEVCTEGGLKTSISALKQYSAKYDWQNKLQEANQVVQVKQKQDHANVIMEMNDRQSNLGRVMQNLSGRGLGQLRDNLGQLSARDSVMLGYVGAKLERLARGEATTRQEITNQMISPVIYNIVTMFQQVNLIEDRTERQREFALGCDAILEQAVGPLDEA